MSFSDSLRRAALHVSILCLGLFSSGGLQAQEPAAVDVPIDLAAEELWQRTCKATLLRKSQEAKAVTALDLSFNLITRGEGSLEIHPRVQWSSPNSIRLELDGKEQVRGPDGDWLREGKELIRLAGRDYAEDRRQIDQYLVIIQNFAALTNPKSLTLENLTIVKDLPFSFPKRHTLNRSKDRKRITWVRFESADLQLPSEGGWAGDFPEKHLVFVAIDSARDLPVMALIADRRGEQTPLLLSLSDARALDDLRVPYETMVYPLIPSEPGSKKPFVIADKPAQELYIEGGTVRAKFKSKHFSWPKQ
ncbi:MAG: hypothetical protein ACI8TQ_002255 [Planctomycetota bacterium]|jgi:hypothetical protein